MGRRLLRMIVALFPRWTLALGIGYRSLLSIKRLASSSLLTLVSWTLNKSKSRLLNF